MAEEAEAVVFRLPPLRVGIDFSGVGGPENAPLRMAFSRRWLLFLSMPDGRFIVSTGLRGAVERLLRGDIRAADIHDLFFSMREESGGSGHVSEIANFIAHPAVRTQGAVWREANDAFPIAKLWAWVELYPIKTGSVPAWTQDALRANLRRIRKSTLKRWTGLNRDQVGAVLEGVFSRQIHLPGGRLTKYSAQNELEDRVFNCVVRNLKGGSLFTASDLFEDFCRALQRQQLLKTEEKPRLKAAKNAISLFALAATHNGKIALNDGSVANVVIMPDMRGDLGSFAVAELAKDYDGSGTPKAALWLFETHLSIERYCDPDVGTTGRSPFVGDFELTPQCRLGRRN